jgi:hypothetical protein
LDEVRFGLTIGAVFVLLAVLVLIHAYADLSRFKLVDAKSYFETGMWGAGHLLQHANSAFLLCVWILLLSHEEEKPLLSRRELFTYFGALLLPVFAVPVLLRYGVTSGEYRGGFTTLMQWGIAPALLAALFAIFRRFPLSKRRFASYRVAAVVLSAVLLCLGFAFGAFIRGPDMRVPGHYHAGIGAVTLAFMAVAFHILARAEESRWMRFSVWSYGLGQIVFASGMFTAGCFGMGRKTYGAEHALSNWGQTAGFAMMAAGGLAAFAGGLLFARAIVPHLRFSIFRLAKYQPADALKP